MSESTPAFEVVLNEQNQRFETTVDGHLARVTFMRMEPSRIIFTHTIVPRALKGQGVGSFMARHVLDYARANDLKVIPQCPFVRAYIEKHPEYQDLVAR